MTPFCPKGLINPNFNTRVSGGLKGINGLLSGHPNLNGSHSFKGFKQDSEIGGLGPQLFCLLHILGPSFSFLVMEKLGSWVFILRIILFHYNF
jgi:hypothetical protein